LPFAKAATPSAPASFPKFWNSDEHCGSEMKGQTVRLRNVRMGDGGRGEERELSFTGPARGSDHLSRRHGQSHGRVEGHRSPVRFRRTSERVGASG
jgi:hypothetical protein